ncbi:C-type lectin domain family 10 member A MMGL [Triplophysa tibetana]|uniref:C-type lectin domain family 10 member A MMGL n=1 Tax=Triplophysa tibetana TaxID=1572043 RepID=A0A5A9PSS0_9TELE|nr:C-type lectin domain family 10 member A MMGL [Triplophysa tibetana]
MDQTLYFRLLLIAVCSLSECIQRRYHYININKTWTEAQSYCKEKYTDLATVYNMNDMKELKNTVNNNLNVWIGLKNTSTHKWKWSLGDPVNYTNWGNEQPNYQTNCTFVRNVTWQSENCNREMYFICYNDSSKRYIIERSNKTWRDAQRFCRENHSDLTSVRNKTENEHIQEIINNTDKSVWIGLFRDSWEWSDNSDSTFRNWKSGEPNNNGEVCTEVHMSAQGQWNDAGCHHTITFVCHEDRLILIKENLTWSEALKYCRENHMDLFSVHLNMSEKNLNTVVQHASTREVWLGLRHSCIVGIWFWVSGEIVCDEKWADGNEPAVDNCETVTRSGAVQSGGDHLWISLPETERRNFICSRYD